MLPQQPTEYHGNSKGFERKKRQRDLSMPCEISDFKIQVLSSPHNEMKSDHIKQLEDQIMNMEYCPHQHQESLRMPTEENQINFYTEAFDESWLQEGAAILDQERSNKFFGLNKELEKTQVINLQEALKDNFGAQ